LLIVRRTSEQYDRPRPTNDPPLWIELLRLDLEAHPPQAAIIAVTLTAEPGSTSKVQLGLLSPQLPEPMRLDVTLARIRDLVGMRAAGGQSCFPDLLSRRSATWRSR
jgi:hypothetical protein